MSFWQLDTWKKLFGGTPTNATANATGDLSQQIRYIANQLPVAGTLIDCQIFNTSGTWNKPTWARIVQVICISGGGGGGGGYTATYAGGGGGGGGRYEVLIPAQSLPATVTVTVGAGGTGGGIGQDGASGGTSSFGSWLSVPGGGRGTGATSSSHGVSGAGGSLFPGNAAAMMSVSDPRGGLNTNYNGGMGGGAGGGTTGAGGSSALGAGGGAHGASTSTGGGRSLLAAGGTDGNPGANSPIPGYCGGGGGRGAAGGFPGGGGGGGPVNQAGASGADGQVVVITYG